MTTTDGQQEDGVGDGHGAQHVEHGRLLAERALEHDKRHHVAGHAEQTHAALHHPDTETDSPGAVPEGTARHSEAAYEVWCTRLPRIFEQTDAACRPDTETDLPGAVPEGAARHSEAGYEVWCTRLPRISEQTDAARRPDTETDSPGAVPGGGRQTQPVIQITKLTRQG